MVLALGFPILLVLHSVYAARELNTMRSIFLRERAASVAARLEVMPPELLQENNLDALMEGDPALIQIRVFDSSEGPTSNGTLEAVRSGRELYGTEDVHIGPDWLFRAYVPFHSRGEIRVAQIDLASNAPDYILSHARNNLAMGIASGAILVLVSVYGLWSIRHTARLELQRQEGERLAQLGRLAAVLAHEIRNPLGTIKGFAQLACEKTSPPDLKNLEAILRETNRLEALVNSLLLYGRPLEATVRHTPWDGLAADLTAYARNAIGTRSIQFTADSEVPDLLTDPDLLKPALLNLIRNSVESIPDGRPGEVSVHGKAERDGSFLISVEDDGPGVPESVRGKLFSPFVTTKASGTGLGLAISKKLVETLGGSLRLQPVEPHGTRAELAFHGTHSGYR